MGSYTIKSQKIINFEPTQCIDCKNTELTKNIATAQIMGQQVSGNYHCAKCELLMIVKPAPKTMLLELKKTIAFIFKIDGVDIGDPLGTGFFVKVPVEHIQNAEQRYFVTAKHVITDKQGKFLNEIIIRVNKTDGGVIYNKFPLDEKIIFQHKEQEVDLVVIPVNIQKDIDYKSIPLDIITENSIIEQIGMGEGDEVFFSGLFHHHVGTTKNEPIFRFGKIALISDEKISWKEEGKTAIETNLYLIECYSTAGNSGSPVFFRVTPQHETTVISKSYRVYLAGVLRGSFQDSNLIKTYDENVKGVLAENIGITAVTPAYKLREILLSGSAFEHRKLLKSN